MYSRLDTSNFSIEPIDLSKVTPFEDLILSETVRQRFTDAAERACQAFEMGHRIRANLFLGEPGTGKTAVALSLARKYDLRLYDLDTHLVTNYPLLRKNRYLDNFINTITTQASDDTQKMNVVSIDEPEVLFGKNRYRPNCNELLKIMETGKVWVILTGTSTERLDSCLLNRVDTVEFALPGYTERLAFLKQRIETLHDIADDLRYDDFAAACEGLSYRDIKRLIRDADMHRHMTHHNDNGEWISF